MCWIFCKLNIFTSIKKHIYAIHYNYLQKVAKDHTTLSDQYWIIQGRDTGCNNTVGQG